jgi:AcrR family transcriptional regulator
MGTTSSVVSSAAPSPRAPGPRERILDVADDLFYVHGIQSVGVDTILKRANAARMSLYNHFGSKDQLVAEYLRRRHERWRVCLIAGSADTDGDGKAKLLAIFDILDREFRTKEFRGCPFTNAGAELSDERHPARAVAAEHRQFLHTHLSQLARDAALGSPTTVAHHLVMLYDAAMISASIDGDQDAALHAKAAASVLIEHFDAVTHSIHTMKQQR